MTTAAVLQPAFAESHVADAAVYIAPARFDVHSVDALARWADGVLAGADKIIIDLRMVDFMDNQMINELDTISADAAERGVAFELAHLSAAAALTFDLLQRVAA